VELVVDADIVDESGAQVGPLSEVAERAINAWEITLAAAACLCCRARVE
jgi:hypothetical protein